MLRPACRVQIGNVRFNFLTDLEIKETWKDLTSTATLTIPKKASIDGKPIVDGTNALFKAGDPVSIELGYYPAFETVFTGFVREVSPSIPLKLYLEDGMYQLKRHTYKKSFTSVTVKQLVDFVLAALPTKPRVVYSFPNLNLGKFRIGRGATGTDILEELRKTYGIFSFFRAGVLYVGFPYTHSDQVKNYRRTVPFTFRKNIIEDDLVFRSKDNTNVKILATSLLADNKSFDVEVGDSGGVAVQLNYYHLSKADLTKVANAALAKYKVSGFTGSFTTFGMPFVRQGDAVELHDQDVPDRNGQYLVQRVVRSFSVTDGYRQTITLDLRIS